MPAVMPCQRVETMTASAVAGLASCRPSAAGRLGRLARSCRRLVPALGRRRHVVGAAGGGPRAPGGGLGLGRCEIGGAQPLADFVALRHLKGLREIARGKPETFNRPDYNFRLDGNDGREPVGTERVSIGTRVRGAPLDLIVAEAMRWLMKPGTRCRPMIRAGLAPISWAATT